MTSSQGDDAPSARDDAAASEHGTPPLLSIIGHMDQVCLRQPCLFTVEFVHEQLQFLILIKLHVDMFVTLMESLMSKVLPKIQVRWL